jgi:hypothetical protein
MTCVSVAAPAARPQNAPGWEDSVALEELHGALVLLGRRARGEGAEIAAPLGARVHFARIQAILTVSQLTDHGSILIRGGAICVGTLADRLSEES